MRSRARRPLTAWLHALEPRLLLSASDPTAQEQQILWLVDRMRTDPADELPKLLNSTDPEVQRALTFFQVDQDLLAQQWASLTPVQPLAWNAQLAASAAIHTAAMATDDQQSHQLDGEAAPNDRITATGYNFSSAGENVYAYAYSPEHADAAFAIDWGSGDGTTGGIQDPPDHRTEMMNANFTNVGISFMPQMNATEPDGSPIKTGPYLVTEDFAAPADPANAAVVGTVYADLDNNGAYSIGEGVGGVLVTATGINGTFSTTTRSAGGYTLTLAPGTYTLTFTGSSRIPPYAAGATMSVTVDSQNILQDLVTTTLVAGTPPPNAAPRGAIDAITNYTLATGPRSITGWAFDADTDNNGADPAMVRLDIDGVHGTPVAAADLRSDLITSLGSPNHGFTFNLPVLSAGNHLLQEYVLDSPTGAATLLGQQSITVSGKPIGHVDTLDVAHGISGWAFDPDTAGNGAGPAVVTVAIDGKVVSSVYAAAARTDLAAAVGSPDHGFSLVLPSPTTLTPGPHRYDVFVLNSGGGPSTPVLLASKMIATSVPPRGHIDLASPYELCGWAADADAPASPVTIVLLVDGGNARVLQTNWKRPDLNKLGSAPFGFVTLTPALTVGTHRATLYGIDDRTHKAFLLDTKNFSVPPKLNRPPLGALLSSSETAVTGWAIDPDAPTTHATVILSIDGAMVRAGYADQTQSAVVGFIGSNTGGFSLNLPTLDVGTHQITVSVLDHQTGKPVLIGKSSITIAAPPPPPNPPSPPAEPDPPTDPTTPTDPINTDPTPTDPGTTS